MTIETSFVGERALSMLPRSIRGLVYVRNGLLPYTQRVSLLGKRQNQHRQKTRQVESSQQLILHQILLHFAKLPLESNLAFVPIAGSQYQLKPIEASQRKISPFL